MMELITENHLVIELEHRICEANGYISGGVFLGIVPDMDGPSDEDEDPEAIAKAMVVKLQHIVDEKDDVQPFIEAVHAVAENNATRLALERARMQLEDCRAQMQRVCDASTHRGQCGA